MNKGKKALILAILVVILGVGTAVGVFVVTNQVNDTAISIDPSHVTEEKDPPSEEPAQEKFTEINFQPVIDAWVKSVGGTKSVVVYDLDLDKLVGSFNENENHNTASLYKLFIVYEGYRRLASGDWDGNEPAGATGHTVSKCLDLAIRESDSACAEVLWGLIGRDTLVNIIEKEWKITHSNIPGLISNANDIMLMLKRYHQHPDFDDANLLSTMWDSFLNQPTTTYDWRMGLPKGFTRATVYDKVGWDYDPDKGHWNIYHDAAIVNFPVANGKIRNYIVVVMTRDVDFSSVRKLGTNIENEFYAKEGQ